MNSIFSYESKPMQVLMFVGDLIILNAIYILCCIPIFTIGAAQAGMFTAVRVLQDPEDDSSPTAAFFRGFRSGFGTITIAWGLLGLLFIVLAIAAALSTILGLSVFMCVLPLCIVALFMSLLPAFHSRFGCTVRQLYRNVFLLLLCHPLRSIAAGALMWVPMVVFGFANLYTAMSSTLLWITIYFSGAALFVNLFLNKPFNELVEEFNRRQEEAKKAAGIEDAPEEENSNKVFTDVPEDED